MKKIQDWASGVFIFIAGLLSAVSLLGIWSVFDKDVIVKSFETFGVLAVIAIVILVASRFIENKTEHVEEVVIPNPIFQSIRKTTVGFLIAMVSFLAFLGVMSIWEVIQDKEILGKSLASVALLAFSSFIVVVVCLEREGSEFTKKREKEISIGGVIGFVILLWIFMSFGRFFW